MMFTSNVKNSKTKHTSAESNVQHKNLKIKSAITLIVILRQIRGKCSKSRPLVASKQVDEEMFFLYQHQWNCQRLEYLTHWRTFILFSKDFIIESTMRAEGIYC